MEYIYCRCALLRGIKILHSLHVAGHKHAVSFSKPFKQCAKLHVDELSLPYSYKKFEQIVHLRVD